MKLVETSSWIHALRRRGDPLIKQRVHDLILSGEAGWCDMVRLELWSGALGRDERQMIRELEDELECLPTNNDVWRFSFRLAQKAQAGGYTIPGPDLLIAACARHHGVEIEHCDSHFELIDKL